MSQVVEKTTLAYQITYLHSKANSPKQIRIKLKQVLPKHRLPTLKVIKKYISYSMKQL